jgi:DNA ligase-1
MKDTTSMLKKKEIIGKYKDNSFITEVLKWTLDPYKTYHVTSKNCKNLSHLIDDYHHDSLFDLLNKLDNRTFTGHEAIAKVNGYCASYEKWVVDLVYCIIDRNLQIRANTSLINKVIPGLIPEFNIALANKYDPKYIDLEKDKWLASRKLDGVRCIAICNSLGNIKLYSRQGKVFYTLSKVIEELARIMKRNTVLDGEICILDEDGNESFQNIMKEIRRKDHTINNPIFFVFDKLTKEEFDSGTSTRILSQRLKTSYDHKYVKSLEQLAVEGLEQIQDLSDKANKLGYEGIMIRKDCEYKGKRSNDILKIKKFHDAEYVVVGLDFGDHRIVENGTEVKKRLLSQVFIEHKGNRVAVGSGFSKEQRKYYKDNPDELVGKTITVQYFEETINDEGGASLRFPVVKHIYENSRDF